MGQKVHPTGIRLGVVRTITRSGMRTAKPMRVNLINDLEVREYILKSWMPPR